MTHTIEPGTVLVTGAGGYIGTRLVERLLTHSAFADSRFVLVDLTMPIRDDARVITITGDLTEAAVLDRALENEPTHVFHLAGILGGAAEQDYALARRVNIDSSLALLERLRLQEAVPRVVYASSIAVYGPPLPELIDDDTLPHPVMTYGAQKAMIETIVEQFSARGWIDGLAVRLPGIVARPDADARLRSAFLNLVFYAAQEGRDFTMPVSKEGTSWLISVPTVVDDLVHAALIPAEKLGRRRILTLPAQVVRMGDLVDELQRMFPHSRGRIDFRPDIELEAQFASQPPLETRLADNLEFRHDGDLPSLIRHAMTG